jgi:hypothetical protein
MKKLVVVVVLPCLFVLVTGVGLWWWERGAPPGFRPQAVEVTVDTIAKTHRGVRIRGTAHYAGKLKQTASETDIVWWVYPLTAEGQTQERLIKVVIRTTKAPDPLLGFEDRTIEGFARPPGRLLPKDARSALRHSGYELADGVMLIEEWDD